MNIELPKQIIIFALGSDSYAISVASVQEILASTSVRILPRSAPFLQGLIDFRGQIIPLISLSKLFGLSEKESINNIIVIRQDSKWYGLVVDGVKEVITDQVQMKEIEPSQARIPQDYVQGVLLYKEMMVTVLSEQQIIANLRPKEE